MNGAGSPKKTPNSSPILFELQRRRVDAVSQSRGFWPVVEDVPQVAPATGAFDLDAAHEEIIVQLFFNAALIDGLPKGRPSAPGVELGIRAEKLSLAPGAYVGPLLLLVEEGAGERRLGALAAEDMILGLGEALAPLVVGEGELLFFLGHGG